MADDDKKTDYVKLLLDKAIKQDDGGEAMKFTQAACNAANALAQTKNI